MSWAYSAFALLFQQRAGSAVTFDSTFLFAVVCADHFENTIVPYRRSTPRSFTMRTSISDYPLDLLCCEKLQVYFQIFATRLSLFNEYKIYGTTYEYIYTYTYIHTYRQTSLAFNMLMRGSLGLAPISRRGLQHTPNRGCGTTSRIRQWPAARALLCPIFLSHLISRLDTVSRSELSGKRTGPAAMVRPVRPWQYRFLREKNGVAWILT